MPRTHERAVRIEASFQEEDLWRFMQHIEAFLRKQASGWASGDFQFQAAANDSGGTVREPTVQQLRNEISDSRHQRHWIDITITEREDIETFQKSGADDVAGWMKNRNHVVVLTVWDDYKYISIRVRGFSETNVVGMIETLEAEVRHAVAHPPEPYTISHPPPVSASQASTTAAVQQTSTSTGASAVPSMTSSSSATTRKWYMNPWVIGIGTAVIAGLIILAVQLALT